MDDADLEKLSVKPGKLEPKFNQHVIHYNLVLPSIVTKITITPLTRDSEASWIIMGYGIQRDIPITPGMLKDIAIEVTAPDGTTKLYTIHVQSLSPSDTTLTDIQVSIGRLNPPFQTEILEYTAHIPWFVEEAIVRTYALDHNMYGGNAEYTVKLGYGEITQDLKVTSVDQTAVRNYKISFIKQKILRHIKAVGEIDNSLICPICLGIAHCPYVLNVPKDKHSGTKDDSYFCKKCVTTITRTRREHPLLEIPLPINSLQPAHDIGKMVDEIQVYCTYSSSGCVHKMALEDLGKHMKDCNYRPIFLARYEGVLPYTEKDNPGLISTEACTMCSHVVHSDEMSIHLKFYCPAKHANTRYKHVVKLRNWEKKLYNQVIKEESENGGQVCIDSSMKLKMALTNYALITKMKPSHWENHFHLAICYEELHYAEDIYGVKLNDDDEEEYDANVNYADIASDEAMAEETFAICKSRGVNDDAPLSLQLKAIDEEYHYLLEHGLSARSDYVQQLYQWKSKQSIQVYVDSGINSAKEGENLGKAYLKFCDALACDPNNHLLHMHVGRHLLLQKNYDEAIVRLEAAVGLNPTNTDSRFYLGLAVAKKFGRTFPRPVEIIRFLTSGIEYAMFKLQEDVEFTLPLCTADIFARLSNVLLFEGMYELAHFMRDKSHCIAEKDKSKIIELLTEASILALHFMSGMTHRGETYGVLKWTVVRVQYTMGLHLMTELRKRKNLSQKEMDDMQKYWERLSLITRAFELPADKDVLAIERKVCEEAVVLRPCSSQALYRLGDAQLMCYDHDPIGNPDLLSAAEVSFRVSIELEGKRANDSSTNYDIVLTEWWQSRVEKEKMLKPAKIKQHEKHASSYYKPKSLQKHEPAITTKGKVAAKSQTTSPKGAGRGGIQTAKGRGGHAVGKPTTQTSTAVHGNAPPPSKGKAVVTTAAAKSAKVGGHPHGVKHTAETPSTSSNQSEKASPTKSVENKETAKQMEKKETSDQDTKKEETPMKNNDDNAHLDVMLNETSYHARLGLARVLVRSSVQGAEEQVEELYTKVIEMAPFVHDAYIEIGDIFMRTDPLKAVDIYCKFPFQDNLTFDDAYLHCEIVRILMKNEKYKDPRLQSSMIAYGKTLGFPVLEKFVQKLESQVENLPLLCRVYAGIHDKSVDDWEMQEFYRFKYWI